MFQANIQLIFDEIISRTFDSLNECECFLDYIHCMYPLKIEASWVNFCIKTLCEC